MRPTLKLAALAVCAWTFHAAALQQPPSPLPVFRGNVDLLTIEASVRDDSGKPVTDLQASDFIVTVDGKPRAIRFARFFHSEAAPIVVESGEPVAHHNSNENAPDGQIVVFAVDRDALPPGTERPILESAARMLNSLSPADAVGLVTIPGPAIDVTRDRARVAEALKAITATRPPRMSARTVTWEEAVAADRGDKRAVTAAWERECNQTGHGSDGFCTAELNQALRETLTNTRSHAQTLLPALSNVIRQLGRLQAPKHLVLVSAGLPLDPEFLERFKDIERAAAEARVTVHTIRLHDFEGDASSDARSHGPLESPAFAAGMDSIASMTGGLAFMGVAKGIGVFDRISSEVTTFYELGVESGPADANGKPHDISVKVQRPHVSARTTPAVVIPSRKDARDLLEAALQQPVDVSAVPIAVTTYGMPGGKSGVKVLVAAEVGAPGSAAPAEWGAVVVQEGKGIASVRGRIPSAAERPRLVTTSMDLPEGKYRLRVAAVDADGRAGTLETPITVLLHKGSGGAVIGDLVLGATTDRQLAPRRRVSQSEELTGIIQMAGVTDDITGTLRLIPAGKAESLPAIPMELRHSSSQADTSGLQATMAGGSIPAGRYTAIATIASNAGTLAQVSRVIEISPAVATPVANAAPPPAPAPALIPTMSATADALMRRVASYVERYGEQASVLLLVEQYTQRSTSAGMAASVRTDPRRGPGGYAIGTSPGSLMEERKLVSDVALVRNRAAIGGWLAFRDVVEANGKPVQDRKDRLASLFEQPTPDLEEAKRITTESARYNIGPVKRTFNVPTATLFFFHPANLSRFKFHDKGHEKIDGIDTAVIEFQETGKPTMIMNSSGHDVPSSGTLWIDPNDGTVVKTELVISGYAGPRSFLRVGATFHREPKVEMWVPSLMEESYGLGSSSLVGRAIYTEARRFTTAARIK
jgi:VWFA-related protein